MILAGHFFRVNLTSGWNKTAVVERSNNRAKEMPGGIDSTARPICSQNRWVSSIGDVSHAEHPEALR